MWKARPRLPPSFRGSPKARAQHPVAASRGSRRIAPGYPSHGAFCRESSAGSGASSCMLSLWLKRRSWHGCLPSLGAYVLRDAPPRFRSAEHDVPETASRRSHHEREADRCLVRATVLVCVRDELMPDCLLPVRPVPVIFRIAPRLREADHTAAAVTGSGTRLIIVCLYASGAPTRADSSGSVQGDHIHDDRCSDRH